MAQVMLVQPKALEASHTSDRRRQTNVSGTPVGDYLTDWGGQVTNGGFSAGDMAEV
jgi:hypothetical protein